MDWKKKDEAFWKTRLTPEQFSICRKHGTERPFSGQFVHPPKTGGGTYMCVACDSPLFRTKEQFDSGSGWPSFFEVIPGAIETAEDSSGFSKRIEVLCKTCDSHLGHVFNDGPPPTGLRYCVNSVSLKYRNEEP
jgi:peptide-methionine (R)-S-oxide reductase